MKIEDVKKAQEIANNLSATIKSLKLYTEGHIVQEQMISRLFSFFKEFLELKDILEMDIDGEGLKYEGKLLLPSKDIENDFIFNLYKDGIRYIAFCRGLEENELKRFLWLLTKPHPRDQDLSTLLWEESFSSIKFARIEALYTFFKREEEKFLQEEAQEWIEKMQKPYILSPPDLKIKEEKGETFHIKEKDKISGEIFEKEKEDSLKKLISNLLSSLKSSKKEIVQSSAKNLRILANMIIEETDLNLLKDLISLLPENSEIKEVRDLRNFLLSDSNLSLISSAIFFKGEPDPKSFSLFLNALPDEIALKFLIYVFKRKKDYLLQFLKAISIFREELFFNFLISIPEEDGKEILNYVKDLKDDLKIKIFETKKRDIQKEILKKLEKPILKILVEGLKSEDKEIRMLSLERILKFKLKETLGVLIEEIEKEYFLKRDKDEKEKWIIATAILGKENLEDYFLSFFLKRSTIFPFSIEERKYLSAIALKILGTKKSLPYLKNELKKSTFSPKMKDALKKAIEEIEKRVK